MKSWVKNNVQAILLYVFMGDKFEKDPFVDFTSKGMAVIGAL